MSHAQGLAFLKAIEDGDTKAVKRLLEKGLGPEVEDEHSTALCRACFHGSVPVVRALLNAGADPNRRDRRGFFPLSLAASRNHRRLVTLLVERGATVEKHLPDGGTSLHAAAARNAHGAIKALLAADADLDARDEYAASPLQHAAMHGNKKAVKVLLDAGADLDAIDARGRSALVHALEALVRVRVEHWHREGDIDGQPATCTIRDGVMTRTREGRPVYVDLAGERTIARKFCAELLRYLEVRDVVLQLLRGGADPDLPFDGGRTALHLAARQLEKRVVEALIKAGADLEATTEEGEVVTHFAARCGRVGVLNLKGLRRADWTAADRRGVTPLHRAAEAGGQELVRSLMALKADPAARVCADADDLRAGDTPADAARRAGHEELAAHLDERARNAPESGQLPGRTRS